MTQISSLYNELYKNSIIYALNYYYYYYENCFSNITDISSNLFGPYLQEVSQYKRVPAEVTSNSGGNSSRGLKFSNIFFLLYNEFLFISLKTYLYLRIKMIFIAIN
jgi:hypothetical protein